MTRDFLFSIYERALTRCDPSRLVREALERAALPTIADLVALGKCAGPLVDGARQGLTFDRAFAAIPEGYKPPRADAHIELAYGSHPFLTSASFEAGERLLRFVASANHPIVFLISGGASACAEWPLEPWFTRRDLTAVNDRLIVSGLAIEKINIIRKHLSAVKGGRLGALTRHGATTFIHSDVSAGHPEMAGSGPTVADLSTNADAAEILEGLGDERCIDVARRLRDPGVPETIKVADAPVVIADNATLVRAAAEAIVARGHAVQTIEEEIAGDVADCANALYTKSRQLPHGTFLVAGGEATVRVTKPGRGGRCSELALRVAALALSKCDPAIFALFGSSDGIDGTSGTAGAIIDPRRYQAVTIAAIERALSECDSARLLDKTGEAIMIPPTGNNLRDLYILARG